MFKSDAKYSFTIGVFISEISIGFTTFPDASITTSGDNIITPNEVIITPNEEVIDSDPQRRRS